MKEELHKYINATPELLSLLYDLDLMPEQSCCEKNPNYRRMMILAAWHKDKFDPTPQAPLDSLTGLPHRCDPQQVHRPDSPQPQSDVPVPSPSS